MDLELTGKTAIVTGSSKGIGLAIAKALVAEGCNVTICARGVAGVDAAAAELGRVAAGAGDRILAVTADLATADGPGLVIARTVDRFGGLDILVNNVGLARGAGIVDTTDGEWQEALDQTIFPAVRASRA